MRKSLCKWATLIAMVSGSQASMAYDFTQADLMFANRANSFKEATDARRAYEKAYNNTNIMEEKVYAISQMARLDIYRGGMMPGIDTRTKKRVLEGCVDTMEKIKHTNRQEFHYYTIACIGFVVNYLL